MQLWFHLLLRCQVFLDVEIAGRIKGLVEQRQFDDTIYAERAHILAQVAVAGNVPPTPAMNQRVGIKVALQRFRLASAPVDQRDSSSLAGGAAQFFQQRRQRRVVGAVKPGRQQRPARPGDLVSLLVREEVIQFSQRPLRGVAVQLAPHLLHQANAQVDGDRLLRGKNERGHLVAAHQREAAAWPALGVDRDTHLV